MKKSIFLSITFIFLVAFLGLGASFYLFMRYEKESLEYSIQKRFDFVSQTLLWQLTISKNPNRFIKELKTIGLEPITYPKSAINILKNAQKLKTRAMPIGEIWLLRYKNGYYIFIQSFGNSLLLKDISQKGLTKQIYFVVFLFLALLLLFSYIVILLKLKPLKSMQKELKKFSKGDLDIKLDIKGSSEIVEVANTLQNAIESLKKIMNSRKLLLRNIMHELKTPITKGRITAEMIDDEKQKKRLIDIFEKLNSLINELAAIEAMDSGIKLQKEDVSLSEIINEAIDLGMFDKNSIEIEYKSNPLVGVDRKLFTIAVKNMIDNGIKYSADSKVKIIVDEKKITFINRGEKLKRDFNYYLEPFTKDKRASGFGLGLYLVNNILKLHEFGLKYLYEDGNNIFEINFY